MVRSRSNSRRCGTMIRRSHGVVVWWWTSRMPVSFVRGMAGRMGVVIVWMWFRCRIIIVVFMLRLGRVMLW